MSIPNKIQYIDKLIPDYTWFNKIDNIYNNQTNTYLNGTYYFVKQLSTGSNTITMPYNRCLLLSPAIITDNNGLMLLTDNYGDRKVYLFMTDVDESSVSITITGDEVCDYVIGLVF